MLIESIHKARAKFYLRSAGSSAADRTAADAFACPPQRSFSFNGAPAVPSQNLTNRRVCCGARSRRGAGCDARLARSSMNRKLRANRRISIRRGRS
jgi:hypothetical protein